MQIKTLTKRCIIFFTFVLMSNQRYNYYDPEYTPGEGDEHDLLIMTSDDIFSFIIVEKNTARVMVWGEQYPNSELTEPTELKDILLSKHASVKIGVQSQAFTVIDNDLFDKNKLADYSLYLDVKPGDVIIYNSLDANNHVVFKINETLAQAIKFHFDGANVFFAGKPWLAAVNVAKPYIQPLYINVEGNIVQLYHTTNDKLDFYNSFKFNNPDELMYYTVLAANELNINLDATSVILSGDISVSDKRIQRLSDLLPKVYFNQNQVVSLPSGFISHQVLMLAGLTLCESLEAN